MVLGGFAGSKEFGGARERDRLLENSVPFPLAETGDGVWRWPLGWPFGGWERWKSEGPVRLLKERLDMWEEKEEGSAPGKGLLPVAVVGEEGLFDGGS